MHPVHLAPGEPLVCAIPQQLHPACADLLQQFVEGRTSIDLPAYVCNMVDSRLIPFVECLVDAYGHGMIMPLGM